MGGGSLTVSVCITVSEIPFIQQGTEEKLKGYFRKFVDHWTHMGNITPMWIDKTKTMRKTNHNVFYSWEEMIEYYHDHRIVFFDPNGKKFLDEMEHSKENIIYCIGEDEIGFGNLDLSDKETVKLRNFGNYFGFSMVPIVVADRMVRCR